MGLVRPGLAVEVTLGIASAALRAGIVIALVPGPEALHAGPGLDQGAIDAEMLTRQQPLDPPQRQDLAQELGGYIALEQALAVLRECRGIPGRLIRAKPDKPAKQQIEGQPLHQLAFRT